MATTDYRFVIANPSAASPFVPGDLAISAEHWFVTSQRGGTRPYIESPPRVDGQEVDLITGKVTDGMARVRVLDLEGTTGGGVAVNEEFDTTWPTRWAANYAGVYPGNPWISGFVEPPYTPGSGTGAIVGGTQLVGPSGEQSQWLSRTFTAADGIVALTAYTVDVRYNNFGTTFFLPWFGNGPVAPYPFVEAGGTRGYGSQRIGPGGPPATMSVQATSDASGNLTVLVGYDQLRGGIGFAIGFDWVHITPGNPAITGRYATINLADANARQQFLGRQAYIEASYDRGATWPHCLHSGYITDIQLPLSLVYEYGIGDTRRTERITKAFVRPTVSFNNTTMLVGGPTRNGWLPLLPFYGFPKFEIETFTPAVHNADNEMTAAGEVVLKYVSGPMPMRYKLTGDNFQRDNFDVINERARTYWVAGADGVAVLNGGRSPANNQRYSQGSFPRLVVEIVDHNGVFSTGVDSLADEYTPMSWIASPPPIFMTPSNGGVIDLALVRPWPDTLFGEGGRLRIPWNYNSAYVPPPTIGGIVEVGIRPRDINADAPLHISMHPVDVVRFLYQDYGITFDLTSYQETKDALGSQLRCYMRVTAAETIQTFIEKMFGVFGFSTRVENGERVFFVLRRKSSTPPTVTITDAELRDEGGPTYELSESTKCNQVRLSGFRFLLNTKESVEDRAWDDIAEKEQTVVADLVASWPGRGERDSVIFPIGYVAPTLDAATFGERPAEFSIPGQIYIDGVGELPFLPFARGLSESVFDRAGRGVQISTRVTRRGAGADDLQLGDEVADGASHNPNAQLDRSPSSQRGGFRTGTVLRREEQPEGVIYTLGDAGTGTVPADITPVVGDWEFSADPLDDSVVIFDIHAQDFPRNFAEDLVLANARIEIQVAFGASMPTTDGIHLTTIDPAEYTYDPTDGRYGDYKIRLGPFETTEDIWFRIRTFVPGTTPSMWTTWESLTGGLPPGSGDISALVVGTVTDTTIPLSWTNTDTANPVTVYLSPDGLSQWALVTSLPPGSNQYIITGLTPATDYDIRVVLAATGTTLTADVLTTSSGLSTLPAPVSPVAFTGTDPNIPPGTGTGIFGMKAIALLFPSIMIFEYADETAVGSGIPDTFHEFYRQPSTPSGYTASAPLGPVANDGKLRFVRAKLRASGYNDSPYTTPIGIDPWLPGIITPGLPGTIPVLPAPGAPGSPGVPSTPIPVPIPPTRFISRFTALAVASNTDATGLITTGKGSILYRVSANSPCRVRLYDTSAERTADAARAIDTEADQNDAVLDVVLHPTETLDYRLKHRVILGSAENPPVDTLFCAVTNLLASTADIVVDFHITPYEA
jgi:hypothetical protein